ncbi:MULTISPECIES: YkvA family protein [Legionella]|uniref:YkvA family protein n=1 Tax=Legionella TaxID=445 RepID=UPI000730B97B
MCSSIRPLQKAKCVVVITLAYALSPIDLIPDFIPVIGLLDDLIIIPFGIYLAIKLIPEEIWNDCIEKAQEAINKGELLPRNWKIGLIIVFLWLFIFIIMGRWIWHRCIN